MKLLSCLALMASALALLLALTGGDSESPRPVDNGERFARDMAAMDGRILDLKQQLDALAKLVRDAQMSGDPAGSAVRSGDAELQVAETLQRLTALEEMNSNAMIGEPMTAQLQLGEPIIRDALLRYRSAFLDRNRTASQRSEALEMLARFPEKFAAINDAVMGEVYHCVLDPSTDHSCARRVILLYRNRQSPESNEVLIAALGAKHLSISSRRAALIGLEGRKSLPDVLRSLGGMQGALGDQVLESELARLLAGQSRPKYQKPNQKK